MRVRVRVGAVCLVVVLSALGSGCGNKDGGGGGGGTGGGNGGAAFLDQTRTVGPGLDWSREVTSRSGGLISFRITCQGPCEVYLLTPQGYQAAQKKDAGGIRAGMLFSTQSGGPTVQGQATLPPGSSWFVIGNKSQQTVNIRLECFEGDGARAAVPALPPSPPPPARPTERPKPEQPRPPAVPPQDAPAVRLIEGAKLDPYTDAVIHTDNTALIAYPGGKLKHVRLSDGKAEKTYTLAVDPYRMVLDSEKGILYAICTDKLIDPKTVKRERDSRRGLYGKGDLYTFDVKDVLDGKADDGAKLTHTTKVPVGGTVSTLLLSPDGAWVYYLNLDAHIIVRVNSKTAKPDGVVEHIQPKTEAMCLTPDGKTLFAASHGGFDHYARGPFYGFVYRIDAAEFRMVRMIIVTAHPQDIRATDGHLLFLSAGSGQHVGVTAVDITGIDTPTGVVEKHNWCVSPGSDMLCLSPDQKLLFVSHGWWETAQVHAVGVPAKLERNAKDVSVKPGHDVDVRRELRMSRDGKYLLCDNGRVIVVEPK